MSKSLVKPRDILVTIKDRDAMNVSTMKTIYNARIRNRTKEFAGRTQMQQLLTKLSEHNYIEWHRISGDIVTDLFWTHPINIDILRAFPHVLIMDCTYKTNRYRFPLLQIVGVTYTNMTFSAAYMYMNAEKEDNYTWALTALRSLLDDNCLPGVIVTDQELALMNSITSIFPKARHLLCRWHINKGVLANCKKLFGTLKQWKQFNEDWNTLVGSETEEEYWRCLRQIESKFSEFQKALEYIHENWLNPFKDRFVAAWTDTCMHLGSTTSNRLEIDGVNTLSCGCAIRRTHQLPCAHEIAKYREHGVPIPLDVVHSHWRKLDIINIGNSSHGTTSPGRSQLQRFNMWYEQQDGEKKRQVHMTLEELMNHGSTALTEPKEKLKTKGRPRKVDTSSRRLPSAFEIAEASIALPKNKPKQTSRKPISVRYIYAYREIP
ncbi:PREDICTED: uncharacterized protein LOC103342376 [Prunus mume]|uniref:Uncharacterized protein LOC103342376 n=1 Tax=Prunus mume TaxID=102107 RepID=A0ABM0PTH0_PRUMU|nr:PREDICTED: uncharacterized protein LOC103342376 [Prunus mume]